ncbi:nuclear pore complex protein Nup160-like, partial [Etheostoma cragini]|uniref:nuclear pore complex protein Nup160-like n=1 Tax=Etheostoma cragini TaxID=417921 RepID=UPI00155E9738
CRSTSGDSVQLVEQSLDTNLLNNAVRLRLTHCSVLPGGIHVQETLNNVVILISTNQSVHRLLLPHPSRMYRSDLVTELHMQSIFTDVVKMSLQDVAHSAIIPGALSPSTGTAWLSQSGEAHYALAAPAGGIVVVTLPPLGTPGGVSVLELKRSSMMQRFSGWMPTAIRGDQSPCDRALSLVVRELQDDCFIFALCQDHKLRMWSFTDQACVLEADMLDYMPACKGVKRNPGNCHRLRLAFTPNTGLCLCVYLAVPRRGQFIVLQLVAAGNQRYSLEHISSLFTTQETLVDFSLTPTDIWGVWVDESNASVVKYINFEHNSAGQWNQVFVQPPPEEEVHIGADQDPRETYLDVLFSPLRFTASAIVKALQIFRRGSERISDLSWDTLKKEVTVAVETELQSSVTEFEFSQEDYRQLQVEFWSRFYACCLQYQESLSEPLGLTVSPNTHMACLLKKGFVSFLLPCFAVDHLYLSYDEHLFSEEETPLAEGNLTFNLRPFGVREMVWTRSGDGLDRYCSLGVAVASSSSLPVSLNRKSSFSTSVTLTQHEATRAGVHLTPRTNQTHVLLHGGGNSVHELSSNQRRPRLQSDKIEVMRVKPTCSCVYWQLAIRHSGNWKPCWTTYERPGASPKRNSDGEFSSEPVKRQVDILELKDLEKEYILSRSRLTLAQHHPPSAAIAGSASPVEMVSLLVQTGLFDSALSVCQTFDLSLTPVFEGLTFKCIKLQFGGEETQNEAWSWLAANQLSSVVNTKESSATDEAWRLLSSYLDLHPSSNGQHHRCVINKLLSHAVPLPDWLVSSYKGVDAATLLRLYLNFDLLDAAAELVLEYIDALLGRGHQYFGIERPLSATSSSVWLPYTSIDQLLRSLNETQTSSNIYNKVRDKLADYHRLVEQTTKRRLATR